MGIGVEVVHVGYSSMGQFRFEESAVCLLSGSVLGSIDFGFKPRLASNREARTLPAEWPHLGSIGSAPTVDTSVVVLPVSGLKMDVTLRASSPFLPPNVMIWAHQEREGEGKGEG